MRNPASTQWGTYFVPRNPVFTSYSSCLVTLTVDLKPYADHLKVLNDEIQHFQLACRQLVEDHKQMPNTSVISEQTKLLWANIISLLTQKTQQFFRDYTDIQNSFAEIKSLVVQVDRVKRPKRSLLPFVGSALSFLFGTATTCDMSKLKNALRNIGQAQDQLVHVVSDRSPS